MRTFITKYSLFVIVILSVLLSACNGTKSIPTLVDVVIVDGDGNRLANKKVNLYATMNSADINSLSRIVATIPSDKDGKVVFDYTWESDESSTTYYQVAPADDTTHKAVTYYSIPLPDYSLKKATHNVSVTMDRVLPFKIRLKSKRNDVLTHSTKITPKNFSSGNTKMIERELHNTGGSGNVPAAFDRTFTAMAFEKRVCVIQTNFIHAASPNNNSRTSEIDLKTLRDSVYLIEF
jgi:hypothetical protein